MIVCREGLHVSGLEEPAMNNDTMYPLFLNLRGRSCVVIGGNEMAEAKIRNLLGTGAQVKVIAREVTDAIAAWAGTGRVQWENRFYEIGDLHDAFLVVTAAGGSTNARVYAEAEARKTLCNAVDDGEHCNCYAASVVRRGPLQLAISTAGNSPALAQRLRLELEQQFGPEYFSWVKELGELRRRLFSEPDLDPDTRRRMVREQASAAAFESFRNLRSKGLEHHAKTCGRSPDIPKATEVPVK
jgi:precorrin-2 dehydrogenase / sirohydrochlorin ferrochelatase